MGKRVSAVLISLGLILTILFSVCLPCYAADNADISENPHVLLLSSYSYNWESNPKQLKGIADTLNGYATIDYVFMDTKRLNYENVKRDIYKDIASREKNGRYDYVIAVDDAALIFVKEFRSKLFSGTPVVFEGINNMDTAEAAAKDPMMTGIVEAFPLKETIALADKINLKAKQVVGISDSTVSGRGSTKQFMCCQADFPKLRFSTLDCSSMKCSEIGKKVSEYGDDTILVFLMMTTDADGNNYSQTESAEYITKHANVPVYKADELGIGSGIMGGVVVSYYDMACDAAKLVLELNNGGKVPDYPLQTAKSKCMFDKKAMDRFGITKSEISKAYDGEVDYVNDTPTFFRTHRSVLIPAGIIIILLVIFLLYIMSALKSKKRLMKQLVEKEGMLRSVLDNIPGGIIVYKIKDDWRKSLKIAYCSEGASKILGRSIEELTEQFKSGRYEDGMDEEDRASLDRMLAAKRNDCESYYAKFHLNDDKGTRKFISLDTVWGGEEKDGSSIFYAVYQDISQQEKTQIAEHDAMEARSASRAKSEFFERMSHDIRTPLNAVLGFTSLARDESDVPVKVQDYLDKIETSGKYLLGLINDVLDMAKIESGKVELREHSVNGPKFLNGIAEVFGAQALEKGIRLVTDFSKAQTPWVMMDELRSRQIYANLLSNAIKFSQSGTEIKWSIVDNATGPDTFHEVSIISDHGCGMSREFQKKMFQPFEQAKTDNPEAGTGLGMPIVKNLVDLMHGSIKVESEVDKGSVFTIEIDRRIGTPQTEKPKKTMIQKIYFLVEERYFCAKTIILT